MSEILVLQALSSRLIEADSVSKTKDAFQIFAHVGGLLCSVFDTIPHSNNEADPKMIVVRTITDILCPVSLRLSLVP